MAEGKKKEIRCMTDIIMAVKRAKDKHPVFALDEYHAVSIATEEIGEMAKAINDRDFDHARWEALDTIAVLVRILEMLEGK